MIPCCFNSKGQHIFGDGYDNCSAHAFGKDGTLLSTWCQPPYGEQGNYTSGSDRFYIVHATACDSHDQIWAADRDADTITVFAPDSEIVDYIQGI